jgi:hydroxymethylbilane synthase
VPEGDSVGRSAAVGDGVVRLRAATRASALARWQTDHVADLLARAGAELGLDVQVEPVVVQTVGDARQDVPIWAMGGKGVFVKEVQAAVLDGRADLAVHSGKDLPSVEVPGLVLAAVPERADARDVLVGATLEGLAPGATVATGSVRRRAQLAWRRPDLTFTGLRGNIATRLDRIPPGGAVVVAAAAIERLGIDLGAHPHQVLEPAVLLPQVAQGALAVECRSADARLLRLLGAIEHRPSRRAVDAERAYLATLGGDCDLPAGAHAVPVDGTAALVLEALLASLDGHVVLRHRVVGDDPAALGRAAADHLLDHAGGRSLLTAALANPGAGTGTGAGTGASPRDRGPETVRDRAKNGG